MIGAQVSSTQTISDNTSVALFDASGTLVDAVAWGSGHVDPFVEGPAFPENPGTRQTLKRKSEDESVVDANDNASDFELVSH